MSLTHSHEVILTLGELFHYILTWIKWHFQIISFILTISKTAIANISLGVRKYLFFFLVMTWNFYIYWKSSVKFPLSDPEFPSCISLMLWISTQALTWKFAFFLHLLGTSVGCSAKDHRREWLAKIKTVEYSSY